MRYQIRKYSPLWVIKQVGILIAIMAFMLLLGVEI